MFQHSYNFKFANLIIFSLHIPCLLIQPLDYQECGLMPSISSGPGTSRDRHPISLISGGRSAETNPNLFPWMAFLATFGAPVPNSCGASIVGNRWLLTAQHCIKPEWEENYMVGVGSSSWKELEWKKLKKIHRYPVWQKWRFIVKDFDIALLELSEGNHLEMNEKVRKICLPTCYPIINGESATVIGWGEQWWDEMGINFGPEPMDPIYYRYGTIELGRWGTGECDDNSMNPWYFCGAGNSSTMLWTLPGHGDSGGPVVVKTEKKDDQNMVIYYQIGIISADLMPKDIEKFNPERLKYDYAYYLAVDHFCEWIRITTNEEVKCQMPGKKIGS